MTSTTIARRIYQAAASFSLTHHKGCGCRYNETLEEFQNMMWLNCKAGIT